MDCPPGQKKVAVVDSWLLRTLSIDNETDDDDDSQPRQTGPRVSFSAGKRSLSSAASQTDDDFFFAKNFVLLQSC